MLDLDDFKQINDRHGHATGNEVLRQAGGVLRSAARDSDVAARFGGEELVLLVREASARPPRRPRASSPGCASCASARGCA